MEMIIKGGLVNWGLGIDLRAGYLYWQKPTECKTRQIHTQAEQDAIGDA